MRWLAHRGGAQHHRRWKAAGKRRAAARLRGPGRRSRDHPGRRHAGAGHALGVPVRRPAARRQGRPGPGQDRAADGPGRGGDRASRATSCSTTTPTRGPTATTPATTIPSSAFPVFQVTAITMRRDPIYLTTHTGRPPDEPSVLGEALNEVFVPLLPPAVPGDRRLLAAARGLQLPDRGGVDEEGLPRPRQAGDAGRLVAICASSCTPSG